MANLDNVESELRQRVEGMLKEGGSFWVTTGHRTIDEQTRLWKAWNEGIAKYGSESAAMRHGVARAARPGFSKHEKNPAEAVDVACNAKDNARRDRLAGKWGLCRPITGESWHMELDPRRGRIPSAPTPTNPSTIQEATKMIGKPAVKLEVTDNGYYIFAADGGVFCFGDAQFFGSAAGINLQEPIIDAALSTTKRGYYLLGADGGLFMFGDAQAHPLPDGRFNAVGLIH
jgi:hypothetical protein